VDGLLGFRDAAHALGRGEPLQAKWSGLLAIETPGAHRFWLNSCGGSTLSVDGRLVVDNREAGSSPREASGLLELPAGQHRIDVRYVWKEGIGYLEAFWQPPGLSRTMLGPIGLQAEAGLPDPSTVEPVVPIEQPVADSSPSFPSAAGIVLETELRGPHGLAAGADGSLYAADTPRRRVVVLDREGKSLRSWGRPGAGAGEFKDPEDIAVGRDGKVYVLDHGRSDVQVFDAAGRLERTLGGGSWCSPAGFTVAPDLRVYVAETCASRVLQYSPEGVFERAFSAGADGATRLEQPVDVAVDARGDLFVADLRDRVVKIDPLTDTIQRSWPVHVGRALGAANLAVSGRVLFLTDPDGGVLNRIDTAGHAVERLKPLASRPLALALGPAGELYVGDADGGRIEVLRPPSPSN
jgi:DNA-binding beta-propeller fold protein YncE